MRYVADRIRGARFLELQGDTHLLWVGDIEPLCAHIERFVTAVDRS